MTLAIDSGWVTLVLLAAVRLGAFFLLSPVLGTARLPAQVRVFFVLALSALLVAAAAPHTAAAPADIFSLVLAALSELVLGAAMGFGLFIAFGTFQFAGKLLDIQIGFSLGTVFDPVTRAQSPLLGSGLNMLALVLFFAMDGHHMMLRAVAYSLERVPPGTLPSHLSALPFIDQFGSMFVLGLTLAAPVVFALLLVDIGVGIVSRSMPQLNVFTLGVPAKILVGLVVLSGSLVAMAPVIARVFDNAFSYWQRLLD